MVWWSFILVHLEQYFLGPALRMQGSDFSQKRSRQSVKFDSCDFFLAKCCLKNLRYLLLFSSPVSLYSPNPQLPFISIISQECAKGMWRVGDTFIHLLWDFSKLFTKSLYVLAQNSLNSGVFMVALDCDVYIYKITHNLFKNSLKSDWNLSGTNRTRTFVWSFKSLSQTFPVVVEPPLPVASVMSTLIPVFW